MKRFPVQPALVTDRLWPAQLTSPRVPQNLLRPTWKGGIDGLEAYHFVDHSAGTWPPTSHLRTSGFSTALYAGLGGAMDHQERGSNMNVTIPYQGRYIAASQYDVPMSLQRATNYQLAGLGESAGIEAPEFIEKLGTWGKLGVGALAGAVLGLGIGYYVFNK